MPRIPQLDVTTKPTGGSVGRANISAPTQAFGGGEGLARLGAGLGNLGKGIQDVSEERERKREDDRRKKEMAEAKKSKLLAEQAMLRINQGLSRWAGENKRRKGNDAFGITDAYSEYSTALIDEELKGFADDDREMLKVAAMNDAMKYEPGIFSHERTEIERVDKENAQAAITNYMASAENDIGMLQGYSGNYSKFIEKYEGGLVDRVYYLAEKNGVGDEASEALVKEYSRQFKRNTLDALVKNIGLDPSATLEQTRSNLEQFKAMIKDEKLGLSPDDTAHLDDEARKIMSAKDMDFNREKARVEAEEKRIALEEVSDNLALMEGATIEEQRAGLEVAALTARSPRAAQIFENLRDNFVSVESKYTGIELKEMKAAGVPASEMRDYLLKQTNAKLVSREDFPKWKAFIDAESDARTKEVVNKMKPIMRDMITKNKSLAKFLPGGFVTGEKEAELKASTAYQRAQTLELVYDEVEEYFKTHEGATVMDGFEAAKDFVSSTMKDTSRDDLYMRLMKREANRRRQALEKKNAGIEREKVGSDILKSREELFDFLNISEEE